MPRNPTCASPSHPRNEEATGPITRDTPTVVYRHRLCPTCGRSQGIARIVKQDPLDHCRVCGRVVKDFEPDGYEREDGQRGHHACDESALSSL